MLMVYQVRMERRAEIRQSLTLMARGRLQTVSREVNPRYYQLISDFNSYGVPVVLNTSFQRNELSFVHERGDQLLLKTRMDVLYLGNEACGEKASHRDTETRSRQIR